MPESKYYLISYSLIFAMAGVVMFTGFMSILVEALMGMKTSQGVENNKFLKNYDELMDILNFEGAKRNELDLVAKSFVHNFLDLPARTEINADSKKKIENRMEFVYQFAQHPNATEDILGKFRNLLVEKCPEYEPDFDKNIEKAVKEKK